MSVIDEVKQRIDIVDVIGQHVKLTKSGRTMRGLCPFHSEKRPSFFVYPDQQSWHCFGACNTGGDVFSFVMKQEDIDFGEALRILADRAGVVLDRRTEARAKEADRLYKANEATTQFFHDLLVNAPEAEKARQYVAGRGITPQTAAEFKLGYSPNKWEALKKHLVERGYTEAELAAAGLVIEKEDGTSHDRFRNRLMFPICDSGGRVAGFGARALDDSLPKYINSPQTATFDKSGSLYGINLARQAIRKQKTAVIVEGYLDAITAHQNGFENVVASMGTAVTEKQVTIIKKAVKSANLVLALDADEAGEEAMLRGVGYENLLDAEVKVVTMPPGKDPDDVIRADAAAWQNLLQEALPVIDYTFNMVAAKLDLTTAKGKTMAANELLRIVEKINDNTRRDHYLNKLSRITGTTYSMLENALSRMKGDRKVLEPKDIAVAQALRPVFSNPVEEYCLALLLQHPELKDSAQQQPGYFEDSQNQQLFQAWQQAADLAALKQGLDPAMADYVDSLVGRSLPPSQIEDKYASCVLRLREKHLRSLTAKREAALALERELGGSAAELAKLEEQGTDISDSLKEVFAEKDHRAKSKGAER